MACSDKVVVDMADVEDELEARGEAVGSALGAVDAVVAGLESRIDTESAGAVLWRFA